MEKNYPGKPERKIVTDVTRVIEKARQKQIDGLLLKEGKAVANP